MQCEIMRTKLTLLGLCFTIWCGLSGQTGVVDLAAGMLWSVAVAAMVYRVGFSLSVWQRYSPVRCVAYLGWLFKEMMVSSYNVAKQLWRFCPEEGVFCVVPHPGGDSVSVPLHANSITLTPGTLTVGCNTEGTLLVHAFTKASREEVTTPALLTRILHLRRPV